MKLTNKFPRYALGGLTALSLSGCQMTIEQGQTIGAIAGTGIGYVLSDGDLGTTAGSAVTGALAGKVVVQAQNAGCLYSTSAIGGYASYFYNKSEQMYMSCPALPKGNKVIEDLVKSPDWQPIDMTRISTYRSSLPYGYNGRAPVMQGFR